MILKHIPILIALLLSTSLIAQSPARPNTIFGKRLFVDHHTPALNEFSDTDNFTGGFEFGYLRNLNRHFNAVIPVKIGVLKMPEERDNSTFVGVDFVGQLQHYRSDKQLVIPYALHGNWWSSGRF